MAKINFPTPYWFRCTGTRIYSEPGNSYETIEVYLEFEPEFMAVKSLISEHGPDGDTSWHGIFLDPENQEKLMLLTEKTCEAFLRAYLKEHSLRGLIGLSEYLDAHGIAYESKYAF